MTPLHDIELDSVDVKVTFVCEVSKSGLRPQWFKGDKALKRDDKYDMISEDGKHSLIIESAQPENIGDYTVKFDGVESTAKLTIKGKLVISGHSVLPNLTLFDIVKYPVMVT